MEQESKSFTIRRATRDDVGVILGLIKSLAEYEKEPESVIITEQQLLEDGFGENPWFRVFVVDLPQEDGSLKVVGMALYFFNYSTWEGRVLYLEDLIVLPEYRRHGMGMALLRRLAQEAHDLNCKRMCWQCLDWNQPALDFYQKKVGARVLRDWLPVRLDARGIQSFLDSFMQSPSASDNAAN
eukprot:TRINITY_DN9982_c0_g1_i1.p1 TRINITY_DN9982_c0_g1~~TRINITY_DN9982_c0_g1_i1.p1  ORF type:complete len:196 (-),score=64.00 TRINITY_DN9982_c0_g1_i1:177-725(-)